MVQSYLVSRRGKMQTQSSASSLARQRSKQPKADGWSPSTKGRARVIFLSPPPVFGSPSPTWGAILMPGQAAYLGHHFDQCFHILENGSLELTREEHRRNNPPLPHMCVSGLNAGLLECTGQGEVGFY